MFGFLALIGYLAFSFVFIVVLEPIVDYISQFIP